MFLKKVKINKFKVLEGVEINYEHNPKHRTYPIASINGGGKSTLLQFIFVMLHCSFVEERKHIVQNLLDRVPIVDDKMDLASFELSFKGKKVNIDLFIYNNKNQDYKFEFLLNLKEIGSEISRLQSLRDKDIDLFSFNEKKGQNLYVNQLRGLFREMKRKSIYEIIDESTSNYDLLNKVLDQLDFPNSFESFEYDRLEILANAIKHLNTSLSEDKLNYIDHFNNDKQVLIYRSNVSIETLTEISNSIYLAAPKTQVFQFFDKEQTRSLFKGVNATETYNSYDVHTEDYRKLLPGFFTYEFAANELIIDAFKRARDRDFENAIETGEYGDSFKNTKEELREFLQGKEIEVDKKMTKVVFKNGGEELYPEDLSHGELKKLSIFIWLRRLMNKPSLVLMDEIDISLHPTWQYEISDELESWARNTQFLLATHSPQIISSALYKNLVVLTANENKNSYAKQYTQSFLDADLNTIIKTIMGADYLPKELSALHNEYRSLVENGKQDTEEGQILKEKILEYESEGSSFFQEIEFFEKLKG